MVSLGQLLSALTTQTRDVFFPSEEDAPVEVVDLGPAESVAAAIEREAPGAEVADVDEVLAASRAGGFATAFADDAAKLARAIELLRDACADVSSFRDVTGVGIVRAYVVGRHVSGHVVGLAMRVVAT